VLLLKKSLVRWSAWQECQQNLFNPLQHCMQCKYSTSSCNTHMKKRFTIVVLIQKRLHVCSTSKSALTSPCFCGCRVGAGGPAATSINLVGSLIAAWISPICYREIGQPSHVHVQQDTIWLHSRTIEQGSAIMQWHIKLMTSSDAADSVWGMQCGSGHDTGCMQYHPT
jgi:hypothetical protein